MNILDQILLQKKDDIILEKKNYPISSLKDFPNFKRTTNSLKNSLLEKKFGVIAEIKRKSPSMGNINTSLDPVQMATLYKNAGVAGISVLTDKTYFGGSLNDLENIRKAVTTPLLRKEFIIDEHQLITAKAFGADCILLIAEALDKQQVLDLAKTATEIGLEVLLEIHSLDQLDKLNDYVTILGVNNRDLKQQKTDLTISKNIYTHLPKNLPLITESGIKTVEELEEMAAIGFQGALIGTSIVGNKNPAEQLNKLCQNLAV
jgi:indole-3-glycerol phosphate synthase